MKPGIKNVVLTQVSLKSLTTFGIGGMTETMVIAGNDETLLKALTDAQVAGDQIFILGGGSNILVHDAGFAGRTVKVETDTVQKLNEDENSVLLQAGAGKNLDALIEMACDQGWRGMENLSLIPGTVGALAIQNVGAYGQEAAQIIESLDVWDRNTQERRTLTCKECCFAYRSSIFNTTHRNHFVILNVRVRLKKKGSPVLSHVTVRDWIKRHVDGSVVRFLKSRPALHRLGKRLMVDPTIQDMRRCICALRQDGRLPDPGRIGSAGSFFKSILLTIEQGDDLLLAMPQGMRDRLKSRFKHVVTTNNGERIKLSVAALIDILGLREISHGGARLFAPNPVIMVNSTGKATAEDVLCLTRSVRTRIFEETGLSVQIEPELVGFTLEEREFYLGPPQEYTA